MKPENYLQSFIRSGGYVWPGGYPMVLIMTDGACLCAKCARENYRLIKESTKHNHRDGWGAAGVDVNWEGPPEFCANCNAEIPSAYGDPEAAE